MSQENVEAVQAWVAAINDRDVDALLEMADPAIEYVSYLAGLSGGDGAYRGHEGLRRYSASSMRPGSGFGSTSTSTLEAAERSE